MKARDISNAIGRRTRRAGDLLERIDPSAGLWGDVLPAPAPNGVFLLTVLPVSAMQTFRAVERDESVFSHARQLKIMMSRAAARAVRMAALKPITIDCTSVSQL